jgi:hypothetical protein
MVSIFNGFTKRCSQAKWMRRGIVGGGFLVLGACSGSADVSFPAPSSTGTPGAAGSKTSPDSATVQACSLGGAYDGANFEKNAELELSLLRGFVRITDAMKGAEADLKKVPRREELEKLWAEGNPSLRDSTEPALRPELEGLLGDFADAAGKMWSPSEPLESLGGRYGKYMFNGAGLDLRQAFEKNLYAAAFYRHADTLISGEIRSETVDRVLAIFGAHPSFPATDKGGEGGASYPDRFVAAYTERRDTKGETGPRLYREAQTALTRAKNATSKGAECEEVAKFALREFQLVWEKAQFATVLFYLQDIETKVAEGAGSSEAEVAALHGLGEVLGFVGGWRGVPAASRRITDAQLDEVLRLVRLDAGDGRVIPKRLVADAVAELPKLQEAAKKIGEIYGFSAEEREAFKTNH